jgi:hypothetical protein
MKNKLLKNSSVPLENLKILEDITNLIPLKLKLA